MTTGTSLVSYLGTFIDWHRPLPVQKSVSKAFGNYIPPAQRQLPLPLLSGDRPSVPPNREINQMHRIFSLEKTMRDVGVHPGAGKLLAISSTTKTFPDRPEAEGASSGPDGQTWHVAQLRLGKNKGASGLQHPVMSSATTLLPCPS